MHNKARAPRKPRALLRGPKMLDGISGEEIFKYDASTRTQRGLYMHKKNFDSLTDEQREQMMQGRLR